MRVLGIDPSLTNFGWAITEDNLLIESGRFKTNTKMEFIQRYVYLRDSLRELLQTRHIDYVGIEYPIFNDLYSEGMYGLFLFSSEALMLEKKDVVFFAPNQVKKHAQFHLGRPENWKMQKGDMVEACKFYSGMSKNINHNEADAYWVGIAANSFWKFFRKELLEKDLNKVEKHQFTHFHTFTRGKKAGRTERKGIIYREKDRFFLWSKA